MFVYHFTRFHKNFLEGTIFDVKPDDWSYSKDCNDLIYVGSYERDYTENEIPG